MFLLRGQSAPVGVALREVSEFIELDEASLNMKFKVPADARTKRETERLKHIWGLLQEFMQDPELKKKAMSALRKLQMKRQPVVPEISVKLLPVKDRLGEAQASMPGLTLERAISLQSQLFHTYSQPEFQANLFSIYCGNSPHSLEYSSKLKALLTSARQRVFPEYGFKADEEGDWAVTLALSEHWTHPDMQALTKSIDELLYTAEAPMVQDSQNLTKKQVLMLMRMQMASFRKSSFQKKLRYLKAAAMTSEDDDCFRLEGRAQLALTEQKEFLMDHGLEPNERGVHALLMQFAPYIMDPEVATYASTVNTLLGMEESACSKFTEKLRTICMEDPGPNVSKKEELPMPRRRHSVGMAGPFFHEQAAAAVGPMGRRRSLGGGEPMLAAGNLRRRRSIADAAQQGQVAPSVASQGFVEAARRQGRRRSI